ncbi:hypothetical protein FACS189474_5560 [Bacteroidia bacterium]|nr:hypothetical protein FACS189474_5560 [Bacteroidia bacterium]
MSKAKNKYSLIGILFIVTAFVTAILNIFQDKLFVESTPYYYLAGMILFLFAYELSTIIIVNKKTKTASPRQVVSLYMLLKGTKIFLFLAGLVVYMLTVKIETKRFVLVAVAIYFIYLLWDTWFLTFTEKKLKKK